MAESMGATELRHLPATNSARRSLPTVSGGVMVMLLSGLVAFTAFLYVTQQGARTNEVLVLRDDVVSGRPLTASDFTTARVHVDAQQLDRLIAKDDASRIIGWVPTAPLRAGDLLQRSALAEPAATGGLRTMSIPVEATHAVGGSLRPGDDVDIIDATKPAFAVQGVEVTAAGSGAGAITSSTYSVTVAVTADDALKVSDAVRNGKVDIVRSTGAAR